LYLWGPLEPEDRRAAEGRLGVKQRLPVADAAGTEGTEAPGSREWDLGTRTLDLTPALKISSVAELLLTVSSPGNLRLTSS